MKLKTIVTLKILKWLAVLVLLTSCNSGSKKPKDLSQIKVNLDQAAANYEVYVNLIDSIAIVKLKTTKDLQVTSVRNVLFDDTHMYFSDSRAGVIFKYTLDGTQGYKIGSKGKGKGEYLSFSNFQLYKNEIHVLDNKGRKVVIFNKNGEFLKKNRCLM